VEDLIKGTEVDEAGIEKAGRQVALEIRPIDDVRSTAEYRKEIAATLFKDVFLRAWQRAAGEKE
jgi:carbon-monoxide dehydrogenase medium subunit